MDKESGHLSVPVALPWDSITSLLRVCAVPSIIVSNAATKQHLLIPAATCSWRVASDSLWPLSFEEKCDEQFWGGVFYSWLKTIFKSQSKLGESFLSLCHSNYWVLKRWRWKRISEHPTNVAYDVHINFCCI